MLNKDSQRELAYLVQIDEILPITGSDNCEDSVVGGWHVMTRKNTFQVGDLAIYFEIDSKVDTNKSEFAFLSSKHGCIKTQKYTFGGKGNFISQGLLMHPNDFGWEVYTDGDGTQYCHINGKSHSINDESRFLTELLGVVYAVKEDNSRKSNNDPYKEMQHRHRKLFKNPIIKCFMKYNWFRKVMKFFFGGKKKKKTEWPMWVKKTDEERVQNMPFLFTGKQEPWMVTEKIDGTSTTFTMCNDKEKNLIVCSRNVVFNTPDKKCYYETNVYTEMAEKYRLEHFMRGVLGSCKYDLYKNKIKYLTIQGETYGGKIQQRNYGDEHRLAVFNVIFIWENGNTKRLNPKEMCEFFEYWNERENTEIETVPLINEDFYLPATCEELLSVCGGESKIDGDMREGLVFRSVDGQRSFKAVDSNYLLKYHA